MFPIIIAVKPSIWSNASSVVVHEDGQVGGTYPHEPYPHELDEARRGIDATIALCERTIAEMKVARRILFGE